VCWCGNPFGEYADGEEHQIHEQGPDERRAQGRFDEVEPRERDGARREENHEDEEIDRQGEPGEVA
jgi:hypothetical protein